MFVSRIVTGKIEMPFCLSAFDFCNFLVVCLLMMVSARLSGEIRYGETKDKLRKISGECERRLSVWYLLTMRHSMIVR